jgi:hypothetical protein
MMMWILIHPGKLLECQKFSQKEFWLLATEAA